MYSDEIVERTVNNIYQNFVDTLPKEWRIPVYCTNCGKYICDINKAEADIHGGVGYHTCECGTKIYLWGKGHSVGNYLVRK